MSDEQNTGSWSFRMTFRPVFFIKFFLNCVVYYPLFHYNDGTIVTGQKAFDILCREPLVAEVDLDEVVEAVEKKLPKEELGERFVPMSDAYDADLRKTAHETAEELNLDLPESVYLQVTGPTHETAAESEFYASCGADTVGMSTACETIALRHMGVKGLCFNCVSNYCPNVSGGGTSHEEVQETVDKMSKDLVKLVGATVKKIADK